MEPFIQQVIMECWNTVLVDNLRRIEEIPGEESEEFINFFD
jgi:hypothetical protein